MLANLKVDVGVRLDHEVNPVTFRRIAARVGVHLDLRVRRHEGELRPHYVARLFSEKVLEQRLEQVGELGVPGEFKHAVTVAARKDQMERLGPRLEPFEHALPVANIGIVLSLIRSVVLLRWNARQAAPQCRQIGLVQDQLRAARKALPSVLLPIINPRPSAQPRRIWVDVELLYPVVEARSHSQSPGVPQNRPSERRMRRHHCTLGAIFLSSK